MLPRENQLKKSRHFEIAYKKGAHRKGKYGMLVVYERGDEDPSRIGIVVSSKRGNAVERNRTKRKIRDVFRCHVSELEPGFDLSYIVWDVSPSFNEYENEIVGLMKRSEVIK